MFDVAVVGAGIMGTSAARHLAGRGLRTAIIGSPEAGRSSYQQRPVRCPLRRRLAAGLAATGEWNDHLPRKEFAVCYDGEAERWTGADLLADRIVN